MSNIFLESRDQVERAFVNVRTGKYEESLERIEQMPETTRRLAAKGLFAAVNLFPEAARRIIKFNNVQDPYKLIGAGSEQTVFTELDKDGTNKFQSVEKALRSSLHLGSTLRDKESRRRNLQFKIIEQTMGEFTVNQIARVDQYPLMSSHPEVIITNQAVINDFTAVEIFPAYEQEINNTKLATFVERYPDLVDSLGNFATKSLHLFDKYSLLVDTSGQDNLVINSEENRLILLDGDPVYIDQQSVVDRIVGQLESLERAVKV